MTGSVTIVITNYNYEQFVAEAIESALAQEYENKQVWVVDDGSTDNSLEVIKRYPVKLLAKENGGLPDARNFAIRQADSDYILFLDADDRLCAGAISGLVEAIQQFPTDAAYAYGQMQYFGLRTDLFASKPFDAIELARQNYICATTLIKLPELKASGGYDNGFRSLREDWELYLRFLSKGRVGAFLPRPVIECRKHKEHIRRKRSAKHVSMAQLIYLYPRLMWRELLRHPLRYGFYIIAGGFRAKLKRYS